MSDIIYHFIGLAINIYILIAVYYYCIKTYGLKVTIITNICLSSLVLTLIFTGMYSAADLVLSPINTLRFGETEFWATDPITIFTIFILVFELARYSLKKTKGTDLSMKDIIFISLLVVGYGVVFQILMDSTAAALGLYYYRNPPTINIFGFPIWFITSFGIYGLYAFVFLLIERHNFLKTKRKQELISYNNLNS